MPIWHTLEKKEMHHMCMFLLFGGNVDNGCTYIVDVHVELQLDVLFASLEIVLFFDPLQKRTLCYFL
jgi:hypothetical protein